MSQRPIVQPTAGTARPLYPQLYHGHEFAAKLKAYCDWFSGVPDSVLKQVLPHIAPYQPAARENHAVAMAFGARVGGRRPCVLIQNSGLGLCGDVLYGLQHLYGVGLVLVVVARGELPWEEPQHRQWGRQTLAYLRVLEVETYDLHTHGGAAFGFAAAAAFDRNVPAAILVHRGNVHE